MSVYYNLDKIKALAGDNEGFIIEIARTFLEEVPGDMLELESAVKKGNYLLSYQLAHKMKPTVDLFGLEAFADLLEVQNWGKYEKREIDVIPYLIKVVNAVEKASNEIKSDFDL